MIQSLGDAKCRGPVSQDFVHLAALGETPTEPGPGLGSGQTRSAESFAFPLTGERLHHLAEAILGVAEVAERM